MADITLYKPAGLTVEVLDNQTPPPQPNAPTITNASATPSTLPVGGGAVVINATVANATTVTLDGAPVTLPTTVTVTASHVFTLVAKGAVPPDATASLPVTVDAVVPQPTPGTMVREMVNLSRVVALDRQLMAGSRYERYQKHTSINATTTTHKVNCDDMTGGGAPAAFTYPKYGLQFAPLLPDNTLGPYVERGTMTVTAGTTKSTNVTVTLGNEADGHYISKWVAYDAAGTVVASPTEGLMKYWVVIDRNGTAKNDGRVVIQNGNFDWTHLGQPAPGKGWFSYIVLPKSAVVPQARALPPRATVTPFNTTLSASALARVSLLPTTDTIDQNTHYPCVTNNGVTVCDNVQGYEPHHMFDFFPSLPLMDGPRGVCTAPMTLQLWGGINGRVYGMTPWSFYVLDSMGRKRTLAGLRHRADPTYWESPVTSTTDPRIEVVADWGTIPAEQRYPRESWGMGWDAQSLLIDEAAAPIGGLQPHLPYTTTAGQLVSGPRYFFVDVHNRLVEGQCNGSDHQDAHKMTVRITGLNDPWGLVTKGRSIFIAERQRHAISEWSMDTFKKIRDVLVNPGGAAFGSVGTQPRRWSWSGGYPAGRDACRAQVIVAPEGLGTMDEADPWLYFGSMAQAQVKRVHLTTGAVENVCNANLSVGGGVDSYFVNFAVSDGSYGPRGSVFVTTFYNDNFGKPTAYKPDGTGWGYINYLQGIDCGGGGNWNGSHYSTGVAVHEGRMFCSDSSGAVNYFCKADNYDKPVNGNTAKSGWQKYCDGGWSIVHGPYCTNRSTVALPWGVHADIDYWMMNVLRFSPSASRRDEEPPHGGFFSRPFPQVAAPSVPPPEPKPPKPPKPPKR